MGFAVTPTLRETAARYGRSGPLAPDGTVSLEDRYNLLGVFKYTPLPNPPRTAPTFLGSRHVEYYLELVDQRGRHVAMLHSQTTARIDGITDAPIARKLSGILLNPGDWEDYDFRTLRIRAVQVTDLIEEPLGTFYAVTKPKHRTWRGVYRELQCQDPSYGFQSTFSKTANVVAGEVLTDRAEQFINEVNYYDQVLAPSALMSSAFLGRPIGSVRYDFIAYLYKQCGITPPFYDRFTTLRSIHIPYAGYTKPLRAYNPGNGCWAIDDTITEDDEEWNVPTEWVVIGKSDQAVQYAGRFALPNDHPMSSFQRGNFELVRVIEMAGIDSPETANARARDQAQLDRRVNATVEFDALADPRLEPWSIITFNGSDWLLDSWSHELTPGGHQHLKLRESIIT